MGHGMGHVFRLPFGTAILIWLQPVTFVFVDYLMPGYILKCQIDYAIKNI